MRRGKETHRHFIRFATIAICLATTLFTSCIFSPTQKKGDPPAGPPAKPEDIISALQDAYQKKDYDKFKSILSNEPGAEYSFILNQPDPITGETSWGLTEELRIHQRMFHPESPAPGDTPVDANLWLESVSIHLTLAQSAFTQRTDLGLPAVFKAWEAVYTTDVLFDLAGPTDYLVNGKANFIVIDNTSKQVGDTGKFLLYRWEDVATSVAKPAV